MRTSLVGVVLLLCSCAPASSAASHPAPATAKTVVLQAGDIPDLRKCPQSDPWAALMLQGESDMLPTGFATWADLKAAGATEGWLSLYADSEPECPLLLGSAAPKGRLVYTVVIKFKSPSSAAASFTSGAHTFPVAPDFADRFAAAGGTLTKGPSTGLGVNSVVATISLRGIPTFVVFWQNRNFEAVVYASNVPDSEGSSVAARMNDRIH